MLNKDSGIEKLIFPDFFYSAFLILKKSFKFKNRLIRSKKNWTIIKSQRKSLDSYVDLFLELLSLK